MSKKASSEDLYAARIGRQTDSMTLEQFRSSQDGWPNAIGSWAALCPER
ncbi:MAG TPA: hypothetical protein PLN81_12080 [Bacillota bacterium]|nr:hypothetical protein [Bacillota bacterium]